MAKFPTIANFQKGPRLIDGLALNNILSLVNSFAGQVASTFYDLYANTIVAASTITGTGVFSNSGASGYATGAGGAVTQLTSRTTGVTLNKACGAITLVSAAGSAVAATFTVTNSVVLATDTIVMSQKSGTDKYEIFVTNITAGTFDVTFFTTGGTTTEQPVFNFAILKAVTA